MSFKSFFLAEQLLEFVGEKGQSPTRKRKSIKKDEILNVWQNLRPDLPIYFTPFDSNDDHSTYDDDGVRITGSWAFIASILARLKELMRFDNDGTKLRLVFRPVDSNKGSAVPNKSSYVFYVHLQSSKSIPKLGP